MIPLAAAGLFAGKQVASSLFSSAKANSTPSRDTLFAKIDQNKSGGISLDEFLSAGQKVPGGKNGVDPAKAKALFSKIDTNGDGSLTKDEVAAFDTKATAALQDAMTKLQELLGNTEGAKKKHGHHPLLSDLFDKADGNSDGSLSLDELKSVLPADASATTADGASKAEKLFAKIDINGDGKLSKDEVKAFEDAKKAKDQAAAPVPAAISEADPTGVVQSAADFQFSVLMQAMNAYGQGKQGHDKHHHTQPTETGSASAITGAAA
jgi:Ca2+-binding EF-hand superfamily protein